MRATKILIIIGKLEIIFKLVYKKERLIRTHLATTVAAVEVLKLTMVNPNVVTARAIS